jgi:hypothetical protein
VRLNSRRIASKHLFILVLEYALFNDGTVPKADDDVVVYLESNLHAIYRLFFQNVNFLNVERVAPFLLL